MLTDPVMTPSPSAWFVYIVSCNDGSLYTGVTKDMKRRIAEHNAGEKGAKYTRARRPVELVYYEESSSRSEAGKREYAIKRLPLRKKMRLIADGKEKRKRFPNTKENAMTKKTPSWEGFEQGPIRPPSEASSLLIRVTRNCPWNRCTFCPVYKGESFSIRPVEHVLRDIDSIHAHIENLQKRSPGEPLSSLHLRDAHERASLGAALHWMQSGMRSVFLQDANSLIIKPERLVRILSRLKEKFPGIRRITSYARSHTICRIDDEELAGIAAAGLNRIHIGMESGSDKVLRMVKKGADKATHIMAGRKVKRAGMELSEYIMPGLGGRTLAREHALETADALNRINRNSSDCAPSPFPIMWNFTRNGDRTYFKTK